jgi:hypothetical protein
MFRVKKLQRVSSKSTPTLTQIRTAVSFKQTAVLEQFKISSKPVINWFQEMAWYDRKENSTGALCARLSGDASKETSASRSNTRKNFFPPFYNLSKNQLQMFILVLTLKRCISCKSSCT